MIGGGKNTAFCENLILFHLHTKQVSNYGYTPPPGCAQGRVPKETLMDSDAGEAAPSGDEDEEEEE